MSLKQLKIFFFVLAILSITLSSAALASTFDTVNSGFANTGKEAGYPAPSGKPAVEFSQAFINYLDWTIAIMGALFMILIIYAGYLWLTAFGKDEQVKRAKDLIIQALIGISVIITARLIVELVITQLGAAALPK